MQQPSIHERYESSTLKQLSVEVWILLRIQFSIICEQWALIFILASLFPFTTLMFLHFFTVKPTDEMRSVLLPEICSLRSLLWV
ncbi:hypothetical protein [Salipaludibacillus neizhouensis]|uniref:hypothetical protein n=1 Tax=Salipaludibacillus neizhouensis TaxID=885475 RepID=UPI001CBA6146|nr:hypothetical protein [Salipaludibacillus neizhouensis]